MADKDKKRKRVYKPEVQTLRITEKLLPELKDIDVGETTEITLKVKMIGKRQGDEYPEHALYCDDDDESTEYEKARRADRNQLRGTFEVIEADDDGDEKPKSAEQKAAEKIMADKRRKRVI